MSAPPSLISSIQQALLTLHTNPYPTLANPPNCSRRASVALILRIRPTSNHLAQISPPQNNTTEHQQGLVDSTSSIHQNPSSQAYQSSLESFFSQEWVKTGVPEVLFIKRAARRGDRWTSHIALPGGKRDPGDASDSATAERETLEEIGLDISSSGGLAIQSGPLSQRVITTDFGAVPLMVLCPFVYILTVPVVPHLSLQPAEVAAVHWIPISALLDPGARTYERADVVDRFASRWNRVARTLLGWNLGQVLYAAVRLRPNESLFSVEPAAAIPSSSTPATVLPSHDSEIISKIASVVREDIQSILAKSGLVTFDGALDPHPSRRLLLWGLTHGITSDFLGLLPAAKGLDWWRWPTLSRSDVRLMVWLVSWRFRRDKLRTIRTGRIDNGTNTNTTTLSTRQIGTHVVGEGLGVVSGSTTETIEPTAAPAPTIYSAAGFLLDGYFEQIQRAVYIILGLRLVTGSALVWYLFRRWRRSRVGK